MTNRRDKDRPAALLQRLDAIAAAAARTGCAQALLGLGSIGVELSRLDAHSDLDFFVIARPGCKQTLLADLTWLSAAHPIGYAFRNTVDGYKVLFADEIYAEFAVFEPEELAAIPYSEGRIVWQTPEFEAALARPARSPNAPKARAVEWLLGEALTCLYVGLGRYRRGEKLSAFRFIQVFVVDRVLELAERLERPAPGFADAFSPERRFEQRFPATAADLAPMMQGYDATPESARAILDFLDAHFTVNAAMKAALMRLLADVGNG